MDPIEIMMNADGGVELPGFHIVPYVAPVAVDPVPVSDPTPVETQLPEAKFSITQVDPRVAVWDKSTGFPAGTKGTIDWGDGSTPSPIIAAQTGSVGHSYANGAYTITEKYTVAGVDYTDSLTVTVPKPATTIEPPPTDTTPTEPPPDGALAPTGPDPTTAVRAFSGAELHWRDTESTDVVDVHIQLDPTAEQVTWDSKGNRVVTAVTLPSDQLSLSLPDAPIGVTPLKFDDGTDHPDLAVCRYKDGVLAENPWPDTRLNYSGTLTVTVNGVQVFQQTGVKFWIRSRTCPIRAGLPQYTPIKPDPSKLPNYGNPGPLKEPTPGGQSTAGDIPRMDINGLGYELYCAMGSTGGRRELAIIPGWDLPWALQGAYWQACRNANDHSAVHQVHVRSPLTGMIMNPAEWSDATVLEQYLKTPNFMSGHVNPIAGMSTCPYTPNVAHQTHFAIVPYLSTQSDFDLEEMLAWACYDAIEGNPSYRQFDKCIVTGAPRAKAWALMQWFFTAALLPEEHPYKAVYTQVAQNNHDYWWLQRYAPGMPNNNPFGIDLDIAYMDANKVKRGIAGWQNHYLGPVLHHGVKLGFTDFAAWRDFSCSFAVNAMAQMCYQLGTVYTTWVVDPAKAGNPQLTVAQQLWTTWDQVKADTIATAYDGKIADQAGVPCGQMKINSFAVGQMSGATGGTQSYPAMIQPALAAAIDAGLPNAQAVWDKLMQFCGNIDFTASNEMNIVPEPA